MTAAPCPSDDDLLRFADGALPADARAPIEAHVDGCSPCRVALSALAPERVAADERLGRYRVDGVLGRGGMGVVLRGHDPELERPVALKLVRAGGDAARRDRLRREARALARLNHPNACQVYDVGDDGDETFVAMELVDGATLRDHLATRPTPRAVLALIAAAGRGLAAAHAAGVVHRDVKPDNLLVARDGRLVVSDFGLAAEPVVTDGDGPPATTTALGTLGYAAPEQLLGQPVDARADQFGLCATAWEALTGRAPFVADTIGAQLLAIGRGPAEPAPADRAVAAALRRGLAIDPAARFPSMAALVDALTHRRRRGPLAGVAVAVAAVATAVIAWPRGRAAAPPPDAAVPVAATMSAAAPTPDAAVTPAAAPMPDAAPVVAVVRDAAPAPPRRPTAAPARAGRTGDVDAAVAMWCVLPIDPAAPDPSLAPWHRADWGPVTRATRAAIVDSYTQLTRDIDLIEVRGVTGVHRTIRNAGTLPAIGALAIVCDNSPATADEVAQVPVDWQAGLRMPTLVAAIAAPPRITTKAALAPVHVNAADLDRAALAGAWPWPRVTTVVARVVVGAALAPRRFAMGDPDRGWILEVPAGTPGAARIATGAAAWIVVADPRFDGGRLTVTARDAEARYVDPP